MSRFDCADDADTIPWEMWKTIVSRALAGKRGQRALAEFEEALLALPERKLVEGTLASEEGVCAVGALVALKRAPTTATSSTPPSRDRALASHGRSPGTWPT
jgi:hypothetical protein